MHGRLTDIVKDLDSPFFAEEILTAEPPHASEPRMARLAHHSPFTEDLFFYPGERAAPSSGGGSTPVLSRPDFWPDVVYIAKGNAFLSSAQSVPQVMGLHAGGVRELRRPHRADRQSDDPGAANSGGQSRLGRFQHPALQRVAGRVHHHAKADRGGERGDGVLMDELLGRLVDLDAVTERLTSLWNALLARLESSSPDALKPFGLSFQAKPTGDRGLLLRRCAELVAVASADPVLTNAVRKSIAGAQDRLKRSKPEVDALAASVRSSTFHVHHEPGNGEIR